MAPGRRIGLFGLGEAARNIHVPACQRLAGATLVAGADPSPEARERFAKSMPEAAAYADGFDMLARERLDWVIIATPPTTHRELCLKALSAGVHVLCEKPFVVQAEDADAIAEAARLAGRCVVVNHEFPYMPIFAAARRLVGSAHFGEVTFLQFWEHLLEHPSDAQNWRSENLTMREFGTHVVDLATHLYGALPERVYARMSSPGGRAGSDLVDVVTLDFPGGRIASVVLDRVCHGPHRYLEMRMDGTKASLRASFGGRAALGVDVEPRSRRPRLQLELAAGGQAWLETGEGGSSRVVARNGFNPFADATAELLGQAMEAAERGAEPPVGARRAQQIVRLVDTIYASARSGLPLEFSEGHT
jgi:predicted dehydrogenase